jgi:hypothetical protein
MTESLHMAIERLLQALDERTGDLPSDSGAYAILRARLVADAADALTGDAAAPTLTTAQMSNELAAYLDRRLSAEDREKLIGLLTKEPDARAALESAAAFLDSLPAHRQQVSPALMAEAMAVFAPNAVTEPVAAAAAVAPMPAVAPIRAAPLAPAPASSRSNWSLYGAVAATLIIGLIGGVQLWQSAGPSGQTPAGVNSSTQRAPAPAASSPAARNGAAMTQPAPADTHRAEPAAKSNSNCDAAVPADDARAAAPTIQDKALAPHADTPAKPCPPLNLHPEAASPAQQNPAAKPSGPAGPY